MKIKRKLTKKVKTTKVNNRNLVIGAIGLAIPLIGLMGWYLVPSVRRADIFVVGNASGTVDLGLLPSTINLKPGEEQTLNLTITAGSTKVIGAQVEILYDEAKIGTPTVTPGSFLTTVLAPVKVQNGKISFIYAAPNEYDEGDVLVAAPKSGSGSLVTITIKPPVAGTSSLTFTEATTITALNDAGAAIEGNVLKSVVNASVTAATPADPSTPASANPSTPASANPSTPASANPTAEPTEEPEATDEPITPAKPNKPTGLRSNCFDGGNKITLRWDAVSGADSYKLRLDQTSESDDKSIDNITKTEYDVSISAGQKYSWWVHAVKDGQDSESAKINEVSCDKTVAQAADPTVAPTSQPTVAPTKAPAKTIAQAIKSLVTKTPAPTVKPTFAPSSNNFDDEVDYTPREQEEWGTLSDIYKEDIEEPSTTPKPQPTFWQKIFQGWRAIFSYIYSKR